MYIHEKIYELAKDEAKDLSITDIRIGLGYTLVELNKTYCGISYSFAKELNNETCTALDDAGSLLGKSGTVLLDKIFSYNLLDSTLAIACANAILNDKNKIENTNIDPVEAIKKDDRVVMIGYFAPLIPVIKQKTKNFVVCERDSRRNALPDFASYFELRKCDVAIISATTIINKTIDGLLNAAKKAQKTVILGPSCIMDKRIFKETSVTHLCGSFIRDAERTKEIISEGGGTKKLKNTTEKGCVLCQC